MIKSYSNFKGVLNLLINLKQAVFPQSKDEASYFRNNNSPDSVPPASCTLITRLIWVSHSIAKINYLLFFPLIFFPMVVPHLLFPHPSITSLFPHLQMSKSCLFFKTKPKCHVPETSLICLGWNESFSFGLCNIWSASLLRLSTLLI